MTKSNELMTTFIGDTASMEAGLPSDGWKACIVGNGRKTSCIDPEGGTKDKITLVSLYNPSTIEQSTLQLQVEAGS